MEARLWCRHQGRDELFLLHAAHALLHLPASVASRPVITPSFASRLLQAGTLDLNGVTAARDSIGQ